MFGAAPDASVSRLMRWVRSGPKMPVPTVPPTAWQLMQDVVSKTRRPSATLATCADGWRCSLDPAIEILARVHVDAQQHLRVLGPAVLRALPEVQPRLLGVDPHLVHAVRDEVRLARQTRDPEAVRDVGGEQPEECRRRAGRVADRHVQLVRRDDPQRGIPELPPPLMADRGDVERRRRPGGVLDLIDRARPGERQHHDDQDRNHRPRELDLRAAVDLRRLPPSSSGRRR